MKTEIANILREAADKIEAVCEPAPLPEIPSLPPAPEGFHPAMMGPIKNPGFKFTHDIVRWFGDQWAIDQKWSGETNGDIYALRKGSEIARMNGLELKLELGRTYATNAGEIVMPIDVLTQQPSVLWKCTTADMFWNAVGQNVIFGTAQPLSHPDTIKEEIPAELLPLPTLPDGFKEWRWRGLGWTNGRERCGMAVTQDNGSWGVYENNFPSGDSYPDRYYLEAIPCTPDDVFGPEPKPEKVEPREWDVTLFVDDDLLCFRARNDGATQGRELLRVREVLPGDPTPEQVSRLVALFEVAALAIKQAGVPTMLYRDMMDALQPFTGKVGA